MSQAHVMLTNPWSQSTHGSPRDLQDANEKNVILEEIAKIAERELREDAKTRAQCLRQLREWISQNSDIENCLLDDNFLLRFLRVRKFSIPMAQQTLLKYLNYRKRFKHIMYDLDHLDPAVNSIIDNGYIFASPFRDSQGRRVVIYTISKFDCHKYTSTDMARAHVITYETLADDEANQILGLHHVGDASGATPAHVTMWSVTEFGRLVKWGEQSFPLRHKDVDAVNIPSALRYVLDFSKSIITQKLGERIDLHESLEALHRKVDRRCLPQEYGGAMPMAEMVRLWKQELASKRERLLSLDAMDLRSDQGIMGRSGAHRQDTDGTDEKKERHRSRSRSPRRKDKELQGRQDEAKDEKKPDNVALGAKNRLKSLGIQMKLNAQKQNAKPKMTVASAFNQDDDDEVKEMPPEAKMRMRNIGRDTPTSSGPNSFGKTKHGFSDAKKVFEKNLKDAMDSALADD